MPMATDCSALPTPPTTKFSALPTAPTTEWPANAILPFTRTAVCLTRVSAPVATSSAHPVISLVISSLSCPYFFSAACANLMTPPNSNFCCSRSRSNTAASRSSTGWGMVLAMIASRFSAKNSRPGARFMMPDMGFSCIWFCGRWTGTAAFTGTAVAAVPVYVHPKLSVFCRISLTGLLICSVTWVLHKKSTWLKYGLLAGNASKTMGSWALNFNTSCVGEKRKKINTISTRDRCDHIIYHARGLAKVISHQWVPKGGELFGFESIHNFYFFVYVIL